MTIAFRASMLYSFAYLAVFTILTQHFPLILASATFRRALRIAFAYRAHHFIRTTAFSAWYVFGSVPDRMTKAATTFPITCCIAHATISDFIYATTFTISTGYFSFAMALFTCHYTAAIAMLAFLSLAFLLFVAFAFAFLAVVCARFLAFLADDHTAAFAFFTRTQLNAVRLRGKRLRREQQKKR